MSIVDKVTVTQFEVVRICYQLDGDGNLVTLADVRLRNAAGHALGRDAVTVPWTAEEETTIKAKIADKITTYAAATGWVEYVPPKEKEI